MWIKSCKGTLINADHITQIWVETYPDKYSLLAYVIGQTRPVTLDTYPTIQPALKAVDVLSEALIDNRSVMDVKEIPKG